MLKHTAFAAVTSFSTLTHTHTQVHAAISAVELKMSSKRKKQNVKSTSMTAVCRKHHKLQEFTQTDVAQ